MGGEVNVEGNYPSNFPNTDLSRPKGNRTSAIKKVSEVFTRAALLKAESDSTATLEECNAIVDRNKRKIFAFTTN
jgi:hypothetical protein